VAIPQLSSRPAASKKIFLNFAGRLISGTGWNNAAYSLFGSADFTVAPYAYESRIEAIWEMIREDYAAYDVDITTIQPASLTHPDVQECIFTVDNWYVGSVGGIAFLGSYAGNYQEPCWVFKSSIKEAGEAGSHEIGHTLFLSHDGGGSPNQGTYYKGVTGGVWAPIMGQSYSKTVSQFSKGEYAGSNNTEDDLSVIGSFLDLVDDGHQGAGTTIALTPFEGVVTDETYVGKFHLTTASGGTVTVTPLGEPSNLLAHMVVKQGGVTIDTIEPSVPIGWSLVATVPAGTVEIQVSPIGYLTFATGGFSAYASQGRYQIVATYDTGPPPEEPDYIPFTPAARVIDTREDPVPDPNSILEATAGAPAGAKAASVTLNRADPGVNYYKVYAEGDSVNIKRPSNMEGGQPIASTPVVPLASDGTFKVLTREGEHVVADVNGYFA
jgi:hypothetical protein